MINRSTLDVKIGEVSDQCGSLGVYALETLRSESKLKKCGDYYFYTCKNTNYLVGYVGKEAAPKLPENYNGEQYVINGYAFCYMDNITKVTIPAGVSGISTFAFYHCPNLKSVHIPKGLRSAQTCAFSGLCTGFTVYCEAKKPLLGTPLGWQKRWHGDNATVVWGSKD